MYDIVDILGVGIPLNSDLSHIFGPQYLNDRVVREEPWPMPTDVPRLSPSMVISQQLPYNEVLNFVDCDFGHLTNWTKSPSPLFSLIPPEFYTRACYNPDALPFKQFMKDLEAPGG